MASERASQQEHERERQDKKERERQRERTYRKEGGRGRESKGRKRGRPSERQREGERMPEPGYLSQAGQLTAHSISTQLTEAINWYAGLMLSLIARKHQSLG
eukprot:6177955-Pleurochrysis_carterae.AAC.10